MNKYNWRDYFIERPCEDGWLYGQDLLDKHGGDADKALLDGSRVRYLSWSIQNAIYINPETLDKLTRHDHWRVRRAVAHHENTSSETLAILAQDDHWLVRKAVANNPNTSSETLAILAKDDDWLMRKFVARHANTPPATLAILAQDDHWLVREAVENR